LFVFFGFSCPLAMYVSLRDQRLREVISFVTIDEDVAITIRRRAAWLLDPAENLSRPADSSRRS
jgi:hypothetical protein